MKTPPSSKIQSRACPLDDFIILKLTERKKGSEEAYSRGLKTDILTEKKDSEKDRRNDAV